MLQLCDVISKWETVLREKGSGKFENTKVIQLVYKNRLYFRQSAKKETDRERLLICYQTNYQIVNGRFPLTKELALELAALMAQVKILNLLNFVFILISISLFSNVYLFNYIQ